MTARTRGSATLVRCLLVFFNVLFVLTGFLLLALCVWALADEKSLRTLIQTRVFTTLALSGVAVAIITICSALLGCFGAAKGVRWILIVFGALLLFFLVATLGAVVTLYVFRGNVGREIRTGMLGLLQFDYETHPPNQRLGAIKDAWDWLQQTLRCCGIENNNSVAPYAWQASRWFLERHKQASGNGTANGTAIISGYVPPSCCVPSAPGVIVDPGDPSTFANRAKCLGINEYADYRGPPRLRSVGTTSNDALYIEGCYNAFKTLLGNEWNLVIVVSTVVALIAVQVAGLGLACHLCRRLKKRSWE